MMSAEHDSLLPIKNVRNHASYGWRYWTKGFCLAMSNNKGATLALLFCYLLQMLQECCPLIESFCKQYFLKHGSYKAVPVVDLVFTVIAPSLVDMVKEFQAVIDREAHRRIQGILNGKRGDLVDDQPLSLNKIMAVEAYYQDIRSLLIKSGAMAITIGSLTTQRPITGSFCVLLYALYSFSDIFYIVLDVTKHQENTHGLVAAKSSLSRHPYVISAERHMLTLMPSTGHSTRILSCSSTDSTALASSSNSRFSSVRWPAV